MKAVTSKLITSKADGVGHIILNQPEKRNAIAYEMWQGIAVTADDYASDDSIRVVVISGAGDKAFSAGADISQFAEKRSDKAATDDYNATVRKALEAVDRLGKPTIAMVQGFCVGGGMSLATHFDMRIASDDSRFGIPAAKLGLAYCWEDVHALVQLIGPTFTREILYTGRLFDATEAQQAAWSPADKSALRPGKWCHWLATGGYSVSRALHTQTNLSVAIHAYGRRCGHSV